MKTRVAFLMPVLVFAVLATACLTVENAQLLAHKRPALCGSIPEDKDCPYDSLGEVKNNSDSFYGWTSIVGTYYDAAGNVLAEGSAPTCTGLINPHDSSPFVMDVRLALGMPEIASYSLRVVGQPITDVLPNHLSLQEIDNFYPCFLKGGVQGMIRNDGSVVYDSPTVCAAFYDSHGLVEAVRSTPIALSLAPGESASFEVCGTSWDAWPPPGPTTGVRLWIDATQRGSEGAVMPVSTAVIPMKDGFLVTDHTSTNP